MKQSTKALLEKVLNHLSAIQDQSDEETELIEEIREHLSDEEQYFEVTSIHRDDLKTAHIDENQLSDDQMQLIAEKMSELFMLNYFEDLETICNDLDLPRLEEVEEEN